MEINRIFLRAELTTSAMAQGTEASRWWSRQAAVPSRLLGPVFPNFFHAVPCLGVPEQAITLHPGMEMAMRAEWLARRGELLIRQTVDYILSKEMRSILKGKACKQVR